jgi:hypothetical protein
MKPRICAIFSPEGLHTVRIAASTEQEEAIGEKMLTVIQADLDSIAKKCQECFSIEEPAAGREVNGQ